MYTRSAAGSQDVREIEGAVTDLLAQEVHDVVGHGLTVIKMHADVALHVMSKNSDQVASALQMISHISRNALEELRSTLAAGLFDQNPTRSPITRLAHLKGLQQELSLAGVQLEVETVGTPRRLPAIST